MAKKNKSKTLKEVADPKPLEMKAPGSYLRESGVLYLNDKFDKDTIHPLVMQIHEYNLMPEGVKPQEIKLIINSPGGSVHWAWQLIDAMKMSEIPIVTIAQGLAASCGVLTLMAGDKRVATHNTSIMSHTYAWGSQGKEGELYAKIKEFEYASARMLDHYKKCTKKSEKYIRKNLLHAHDEWLTPEEALKHGILDEIWETY
jgi:ATP-dependent Clp protease protease subunit